MTYNRRKFVKKTGLFVAATPLLNLSHIPSFFMPNDAILDISIFSKHLQFLDIKEAAQIAAELGFVGLDVTVRPKGHIPPETVATGLPKAIVDINEAGSSCKMITTEIEDASKPIDKAIIEAAGKSGIQFYRANWFTYQENLTMVESLTLYQHKIKDLSELNRAHKIVGCYQNHAGTKIGASFWEIEKLLETADPDYFGTQYDIRHAVADGGFSWENGLKLLHKRVKTIVLKDFKWAKENGRWKLVNVPIGKGMVDFPKYFKLLKLYGLNPPVSLHLEYNLGGAEKGKTSIAIDKKIVFDAMKSDLLAVRKLWKYA